MLLSLLCEAVVILMEREIEMENERERDVLDVGKRDAGLEAVIVHYGGHIFRALVQQR